MNQRQLRAAALPILCLLWTLAEGASQAQKYTVTRLDDLPGGTYTTAAGMNNAGVVVGTADDAAGNSQPVAWTGATPRIVFDDSYPGIFAEAYAINAKGVIIGSIYEFEAGIFEVGPNISVQQSYDHGISADAINGANVIVGSLFGHPVIWDGVDVSQDPASLPTTANHYGAGSAPNGINDAGVIVGTEFDEPANGGDAVQVAVRWKPDPVTHAPGATVKALGGLGGHDSVANAVNAGGAIAGWATLGNGLEHAVLWGTAAGPYDLGTLGGKRSAANAINVEGDIAGEAQTPSGVWHAALWTHKHLTVVDLNLEIGPTLAKQVTLTSAVATNDRCQLLANGIDKRSGAQESFLLSLTNQGQCNLP